MPLYGILLLAAIVVFVQGKWYQSRSLRNMRYSRYFNQQSCYAGDAVQLVEEIENNKLLPLPWLRLESLMHAGLQFGHQDDLAVSRGELFQNHKSLFSLMPYTKWTRRHHVRAMQRGCYDLQSVTMTSGDLLGMFTTHQTITFPHAARLLVYPALVDVEQIPLPAHGWQGDFTVRRWIVEDPFLVTGARPYRAGDPMHHINWKATARSGQLHVHQHDYTADHRIMLLVNFDLSDTMWGPVTRPERIENALSYAASILHVCIDSGIETGFGCNGHLIDVPKQTVRIEPVGGHTQLETMMETMAMLQIASVQRFADMLQLEVERGTSQMDYIIVSTYRSERLDELSEQLEQHNNAVRWIVLDPEQTPAAERRAR